VTQNTQKNNELAFKADDGLGSDIQVTEEADDYSRVIPEKTAERIGTISGVASVNPVNYLLGEIPLYHNIFHWTSYFPETAGQKGFKQDQIILDNYNGIIVKESKNNYRLKVNVYGYSDKMLEELRDYRLSGSLNPQKLKKENTVILKTLMDGQGNYNGIDIKPGDTITLKVSANRKVPKEALRFQGNKSWYQEKKFKVAALVNRPLAKVNNFIGDDGMGNVAVIMSNAQMKKNFGADDYQSISIQLKKGAEDGVAAGQIRKAVGEIPHCVIKDYTGTIAQQNLYLKQKMIFFYGIGIVLLAISLLHIMNSMQYLVVSRKHEFGILRAMGMTDTGFYGLMITEGIQYGIYTGVVMIVEYLIVQKVLYYFMVHVYRYLKTSTGLSIWQIAIMVLINIAICIITVLFAGKEVLKQSILEEIHA
jgi:ABC-type antimicrobial peptide transport system permease subunit